MRPLKWVIQSPKRLDLFLLVLLALSFLFCSPSSQAANTQDIMMPRIEGLEKKLDEIQKQQTSLLSKIQELSEKLDTLKVWAHRG